MTTVTYTISLPETIEEHIVEIAHHEVVSMNTKPNQLKIKVLSGTAWLTQENDPEDHLLTSGADFEISQSGKVVIEALDKARIAVISLN